MKLPLAAAHPSFVSLDLAVLKLTSSSLHAARLHAYTVKHPPCASVPVRAYAHMCARALLQYTRVRHTRYGTHVNDTHSRAHDVNT